MKKHSSHPAHFPRLAVISAAALVALFLGIYYGSYHYYGYATAPGGDIYNHIVMMRDLTQRGFPALFSGYPRLFHLILLTLSSITGLNPLRVLLYMVPALMVISSLAAAWVGYLIAGSWAGVATLFLLLYVGQQPWQTLYDGGFPNILAASVWLPLWIGIASLALGTRKKWYIIPLVVLSLAIVLTHHITAGYLIMLCAGLFLFMLRLIRLRWVALCFGLIIAFLITPLSSPLWNLSHSVFNLQSHYPWVHFVGHLDNPNAIWQYKDYVNGIGWFILYIGLAGLLTLLVRTRGKQTSAIASYLLLLWTLLLLGGSRLQVLGFPLRLARDAGLPLAISAGILVASAIRLFPSKILQVVGVVMVLFVTFPALSARIHRITSTYEQTMQYSWADQQAVRALGNEHVASLGAPLPSVAASSVDFLTLYLPHDMHLAQKIDHQLLLPYNTVVSEDRLGNSEDAQTKLILLNEGFVPDVQFTDPLKTVVVFRR